MKILINRRNMLWSAALGVDILDAQEKATLMPPSEFRVQQSRQRVPAMQRPIRARRKAKHRRTGLVVIRKRQMHGAQT